jgi:hypothetical protein
MRVLVLGAGASKCAGYPLASELIAEIKQEAETTSLWNFSKAWREWNASLKNSRGLISLLLRSPNPEVVLSVPDLFDAAWNAELRENFADFRRVRKGEITDKEGGERARQRALNARRFQNLIIAKERFRECIDWFFRFKHVEDSQPEIEDVAITYANFCLH